MGNLEQDIIAKQLEDIKKRPEHVRGEDGRKLLLERYGVLEIKPKEKKQKILRPINKIFLIKIKTTKIETKKNTSEQFVPEQPELFRNENDELVIKRPD
ncbi:MAG: hypothetical protein WCK60_01550 [Candidatus Nomurabacteria bacterium]